MRILTTWIFNKPNVLYQNKRPEPGAFSLYSYNVALLLDDFDRVFFGSVF